MSFEKMDELLDNTVNEVEAGGDKLIEAVQRAEGAGEASNETCTKIMTLIATEAKSNLPGEVLITVAYLLQRGATSPKTPSSTKFSYGTTTVTVEQIRKACRIEKVTVRQFARGMKDRILRIMQALGDQAPEGNLAKTMRLDIPKMSKEEAVWASDFQTYNPDCPTRVKNWLVKNYRERFRKQ